MNVLSLFDGKSSGFTAMELAGIPITKYYSSEVDDYAIKVSNAIHPNQIRLGDVTKWREWDIDWASIDVFLAGSPCQGFSLAGQQGGTKAIIDGKEIIVSDRETYLEMKEKGAKFLSQSYLFWEYVLCLDYAFSKNKNLKFMLENVKMSPANMSMITNAIGVNPVFINSSLVSAQNRQRYYWANWHIEQPEDREIMLESILEDLPDCPIGVAVREKSKCLRVGGRNSPFGSKQEWDSPFQRISKKGKVKPGISKAACLTGGANSGGNHSDMDIIHSPYFTRRYSVRECFRLQTVPEHYIDKILSCGVSNSQLYKIAGNGWTDEAIAHILNCIPKSNRGIMYLRSRLNRNRG